MTPSDTTIANRSPTLLTGVFYGLLTALLWGSWPVLSRLGVTQSLPPQDLTALRFSIAGIVLLPVIWRRGFTGVGYGPALLLALGAGAPYMLVMMYGLSLAPAGHAGIITPSCMLMLATLGGWLWLGDRLNRTRVAGLLLVLAGIAMLGWSGFTVSGPTTLSGDLLFILGGALWASYTLLSKAWSVEPLHATALVAVISMIGYLPLYLLTTPSVLVLTWPSTDIIFHALYQGLLIAVLALLFYTRTVAILGAARGALFAALVPAVSVLLAFPVLGEKPTELELLGLVTVTGGMVIALGGLRYLTQIKPGITSAGQRRSLALRRK